MEQVNKMVLKAKEAYVEKAEMTPEQATIAGNAYVDAIDDVMEGVYYMLRTLGPQGGVVWTTKKGHKVNAMIEAV